MKLVIVIAFLGVCQGFDGDPHDSINVTHAITRVNYNGTVGGDNRPNLYYFEIPKDQTVYIEPSIPSSSWNDSDKVPVSINAWIDNAAISFMLPLKIDGFKYYQTRRFVCPSEEEAPSQLYISVSSTSKEEIKYRLQARSVERGKFIIDKLDRKGTDFAVGPAWPDAFEFVFPDDVNVVDIVVAGVHDDKLYDQTAVMFVQEPQCPMLSTLNESNKAIRTVLFTRHATTTLMKTSNQQSVFLSFISTKNVSIPTEKKKIHLTITKSGSDMSYSPPLGAAIGISLVIFLLPAVFVVLLKLSGRRGASEMPTRSVPISGDAGEGSMAQPQVYDETPPGQADFGRSRDRLTADPEVDEGVYTSISGSTTKLAAVHWMNLGHVHRIVVGLVAVAVMIVFAVMLTLNKQYEKTDLCYFNYECLRYTSSVSAFNHVFSSGFAYATCAVFLAYYLAMLQCCFLGGRGNGETKLIRPIIGAVVLCVAAQAFVASLYNSCPTRFLHFTENAFLILALFIGIAAFYPSLNQYWMIGEWIALTVIGAVFESPHLGMTGNILAVFCTVVIIFSLGMLHLRNIKRTEDKSYRQLVYYPGTYATIVWCLIQAGCIALISARIIDYPGYITISTVIISCLYMGYHIARKCENESKAHYLGTLALALTGLAFWIIGLVFYFQKRVDIMAPSALSRMHNGNCVLFSFYDPSDIWAFCSAYAIFFQFMSLMFYKAV